MNPNELTPLKLSIRGFRPLVLSSPDLSE
jgi:hypothetical protein